MVGQSCEFASATNPFANQQAWIWSAQGGVQCLQVPRIRVTDNFIGTALATSEDGRVVGGSHSFGLEAESVIWIDREPAYLRDYLRDNGVPDAFEGWVNTGFVTAVSRDGRVIAGYGAGPRDFQGFIVILRRPVMSCQVRRRLALMLLLIAAGSAPAQSWEASGLAGFTPAGWTRTGAGTDRREYPRRVHLGCAGRAVLHTAVGCRGRVDPAGFGTRGRDVSRNRRSLSHHAVAAAREPRVSIRRRRRAAAAVRVRRRRRHVPVGGRSRIRPPRRRSDLAAASSIFRGPRLACADRSATSPPGSMTMLRVYAIRLASARHGCSRSKLAVAVVIRF